MVGINIDNKLKEVNLGLKKCTISTNGTKDKKPTCFILVFSFYPHGYSTKRKQFRKGIDCEYNAQGLKKAIAIAEKVNNALIYGHFSWQWFDTEIKNKQVSPITGLDFNKSFGDFIENFKNEINVKPTTFLTNYMIYFQKVSDHDRINPVGNLPSELYHELKDNAIAKAFDKPLTPQLVEKAIKKTTANSSSRKRCIHAFNRFLTVTGLIESTDFKQIIDKYSKNIKYSHKDKYIPTSQEILEKYLDIFKFRTYKNKKDTYDRYAMVYAILTLYGLRIHELWEIKNWDCDVYYCQRKKDFIKVDGDFSENNIIIPSVLSDNNDNRLLAIGNSTKTGSRVTFPVPFEGVNSFEFFNLNCELKLPIINRSIYENEGYTIQKKRSAHIGAWFINHIGLFSAHALRHAYNLRGKEQGYDVSTMSLSLGHSEVMNSSTYMKYTHQIRQIEFIQNRLNSKSSKKEKLLEIISQTLNNHLTNIADINLLDVNEIADLLVNRIEGII
jgi:integrase